MSVVADPISYVQNSNNVSDWEDVTDMRHDAEEAFRFFYEKMIDDRHALESQIRTLQRHNREYRGEITRLKGLNGGLAKL